MPKITMEVAMGAGGYREGSGRKPLRGVAKVVTSVTLTPEVREYLDQRGMSRGESIESLVRKTKEFREWLADSR